MVALSAVAVAAGCSDDSEEKPSAPKQAGGELFVQVAGGGSLRSAGQPGTYTLRLTDPNDKVTVFTDRPERRAGSQKVEDFVKQWKSRGFDDDPPNAALEIAKGSEGQDVKVFEISAPRLDPKGDVLEFRAKELGDRASTALSGVAKGADQTLPERFERASLFVDPGATSGTPKRVTFTMTVKGDEGEVGIDFDSSQTLFTTVFKSDEPEVVQASVGSSEGPDLRCDSDTSDGSCRLTAVMTVISTEPQVTGTLDVESGSPTVTASVNGGTAETIGAGPFSLPKSP